MITWKGGRDTRQRVSLSTAACAFLSIVACTFLSRAGCVSQLAACRTGMCMSQGRHKPHTRGTAAHQKGGLGCACPDTSATAALLLPSAPAAIAASCCCCPSALRRLPPSLLATLCACCCCSAAACCRTRSRNAPAAGPKVGLRGRPLLLPLSSLLLLPAAACAANASAALALRLRDQ